jgi:hypothetical protein
MIILSKKIRKLIDELFDATNYTIVLYKNDIISIASPNDLGSANNYISRRTRTDSLYFSRHCETVALANSRVRKILLKRRKISNIKIINFRLSKSGLITNGCCCLACCKTLERFGISKITYSDYDGNFIKSNISDVKKTAKYSRRSRELLSKN